MLFHIFTEERKRRKIQLHHNFLNAFVWIRQQIRDVFRHRFMNQHRSRLATSRFTDRRQILRRYIQCLRIKRYGTRFRIDRCKQIQKSFEQIMSLRVIDRTDRNITSYHAIQFTHKRFQQTLHGFPISQLVLIPNLDRYQRIIQW